MFDDSKNEELKEMFGACRVDTEDLSFEESSPFAGVKYFSELRSEKSVKFSVVEVMISSNLKYISLEADVIRCSRK